MKFGTDGIRGIYGEELTERTAYRLGGALGREGSVLIGRDNRPSSLALARAVACGVMESGGTYLSVGLVTTPALCYLTREMGFFRGVMVTASHNPPSHNGLKVFTQEGKPSNTERTAIEDALRAIAGEPSAAFPLTDDPAPLTLYEDRFRKIGSLKGMTAVVDYAGGAGFAFGGLLSTLGATVIPLNLRKDGGKINEGCGALYPELCARETRIRKANLGFALDGDGDRIIAADQEGNIWDGDRLCYLLAVRMKARGALNKNKVALTVMTNGGVLKSLSDEGITPVSCAVGDSAVAETMQAEGLNLGGEQSGHIILGDYMMTGDALYVGATLLKSIKEEGPLSKTPAPTVYPQVRLDLPVPNKKIAVEPALQAVAAEIKEKLGEGRVLLRASGTEPLIRIMVEHPNKSAALCAAERLKEAVLSYSHQASTR